MAKRRRTSPRRARRPSMVLGRPANRLLLLDLIVEMHHIAEDVATKLGATGHERRLARERAVRVKTRTRPSTRFMAAINGAGNVLSTWRRDPRFQSGEGVPRVLKVRGKGATLEALVRECVPELSVEEVLGYICSHGEAKLYKGDRVALLGSSAVLTQRTPETTLAWMLTQFRHVAETSLHNASIPAARVKGMGLFQRQVAGYLSNKDFKQYAKDMFPRLQLLCAELEAGVSLKRRARSSRASRKECGVGIFVYQDAGDIG
jgi:hypothetical protein